MKKLVNEFKDFALQGKVMNLAIGIIIGAAFQGVVTSLTENILSPIIGLFTRANLDALSLNVFEVTIRYGAFITSVLNFLILTLVVFTIVKVMNRILPQHATTLSDMKSKSYTCPFCKTNINADATRCPACTSQIKES